MVKTLPLLKAATAQKHGYRAHPDLGPAFPRAAQTIAAGGKKIRTDPFVPMDTAYARGSFVPVPRWMVLRSNEGDYQREYLKTRNPLVAALGSKFHARTGVLFFENYHVFAKKTLAPLRDVFQCYRPLGLEMEFSFSVYGVVQKCGFRAMAQRLFQLVRTEEGATVGVTNAPADFNRVDVTIREDFFAAAILRGMLAPERFVTGVFKAPRILHGIDIGWGFAPHNIAMTIAGENPALLPMGYHLYTANVTEVGPLCCSPGRLPETALAAATLLEFEAHRFASTCF